jgi:rubrerythrin
VEKSAAEIYKSLADIFPQERAFFMGICHEEEDHAAILSMSKLYKMLSRLPENIVPESMNVISEALSLSNEIKGRIAAEDISLKEALSLAFRMEKSLAEEHLQLVLSNETDSETIEKLKKLRAESMNHADRILSLMNRKGFCN